MTAVVPNGGGGLMREEVPIGDELEAELAELGDELAELAALAHREWTEEDLEAELPAIREKYDGVQSRHRLILQEYQATRRELGVVRQGLDRAQVERDELRRELEGAREERGRLRGQVDLLTSTLERLLSHLFVVGGVAKGISVTAGLDDDDPFDHSGEGTRRAVTSVTTLLASAGDVAEAVLDDLLANDDLVGD